MGFNKITNKETKNGRSSEEQNRRTLKATNYRISHNYILYIIRNPLHTDIQRTGTINLLLCSTLSKLPSHKKMRYPTITFRVYHN